MGNKFHFKDRIPKDLTSGVVYKFQRGLCNEHIGVSPLTEKQVKPKNSSVADHLLFCNHSASYDDFNAREQKVFTRIEREPVNNE